MQRNVISNVGMSKGGATAAAAAATSTSTTTTSTTLVGGDMTLAKAVIPAELEERLLATLIEHHPVADEAGSQSSTTVLRLQRAYDELRATGLPPDVSWRARTRALHALLRLVHTSEGSCGGGVCALVVVVVAQVVLMLLGGGGGGGAARSGGVHALQLHCRAS
jgi:hypothetical protein